MSDEEEFFKFPGPDERFIYTNEENRYFNRPLTTKDPEFFEEKLNWMFSKGRSPFWIDPQLPEKNQTETYRKQLLYMRSLLEKAQEQEIKNAIDEIKESYKLKFCVIDIAIEKLDKSFKQVHEAELPSSD